MAGLERRDLRVVLGAGLVEQRRRGFQVFLKVSAFVGENGLCGLRFLELLIQTGHGGDVLGDRFRELVRRSAMALDLGFVRGADVGNLLLVIRLRLLQPRGSLVDPLVQSGALARCRVERGFQIRVFRSQFRGQFFLRF